MKADPSCAVKMFQEFEENCSEVIKRISMDQSIFNEIGRFAREALAGDSETARARLRRLLPKIDKVEPALALALGTAVSQATVIRGKVFDQAPLDADTRQNLLFTTYPVRLLIEPTFSGGIDVALQEVLREWKSADVLLAEGLAPTRSLLFSGPPGVGKSLAAAYLAKSLDLPLLTLDLATVMSSFLGKTGSNLRMVLDYAQSFPCVLFLDEFDTIAKRRNDDADVGELKRLVTVLLQSIDHWPSNSLLIAATNHGELLDPAAWRRFDVTLDFPLPDMKARQRFFMDAGLPEAIAIVIADQTDNKNYSTLERIVSSAKKEAVLEQCKFAEVLAQRFGITITLPSTNEKEKSLPKQSKAKRNTDILSQHCMGMSSREIGKAIGMSHSTVLRIINKAEGNDVGKDKSTDRKRRSTDKSNTA